MPSTCTYLQQMRNTGTRLTNAQFPFPQFFVSPNCPDVVEDTFPRIDMMISTQKYHVYPIVTPFLPGSTSSITTLTELLKTDACQKCAMLFSYKSWYIPPNFQMVVVFENENKDLYANFYDSNTVVENLSNLKTPMYKLDKLQRLTKLVGKMVIFRVEIFFEVINDMCINNRQVNIGPQRQPPFGNTNWLSHTWRPGDRNCNEHSIAVESLTSILPELTRCHTEKHSLDAVYGQKWNVPACGFGSRGNRATPLRKQYDVANTCFFSDRSIKSGDYFNNCPQTAFCDSGHTDINDVVNIQCNTNTKVPPYPDSESLPVIKRFQANYEIATPLESIPIVNPLNGVMAIVLCVFVVLLLIGYGVFASYTSNKS